MTAWSDKHAAYDILQGPSGDGIQDLFTPEINSTADTSGDDWTKVNSLTQQYDSYKVAAVVNEIDGYDHSRSIKLGVPAIFGMNFQSVSTAEKLPASGGQAGGYLADGVTPGPVLTAALTYVDTQIGKFTAEINARGLAGSTDIIVSAKHGQSPTDPAQLTRISDGPIVDALNAAWTAAGHSGTLVSFAIDDDAMLMWLSDRSAGRGHVRQAVPARLQRHRKRHHRRGQAVHRLRPRHRLRRYRRQQPHRRPAQRLAGTGPDRPGPAGCRLHRWPRQDRRARRRYRGRPGRTDPGVRAGCGARPYRHHGGAHHPDRADHPHPARPAAA